MKKIEYILFWLTVCFYLAVVLGFVNDRGRSSRCSSVQVNIRDSTELKFVTVETVMEMIDRSGGNIVGRCLDSVNTKNLEHRIRQHPAVRNAEIYTTVQDKLVIEVEQRKPLLRIKPEDRAGYYIDQEGFVFPATPSFSPFILVVTGHITVSPESGQQISGGNGSGRDEKILEDLIALARYMNSHDLWKAQIVQIYVDDKGEIELIPRVGANIVRLGKPENFRQKLDNLEVLYAKGFSNIGWNHYDAIDLRYNNQVICTKR